MDELPATQTQEEYTHMPEIQIQRPWGRLCTHFQTLESIDLFNSVYTFGRSPKCDIYVENIHIPTILQISKEHFRLNKESDGIIYITDLSKNGTYINDKKVGKNNKQIIYNDDVISIGHPNYKIYTLNCNVNLEDYNYPLEMRQKYFIAKKIGQGAFGEVWLTLDKRTCEKYAIKKIKSCHNSSTVDHEDARKIKTEIEILTSFSFPFIIKMKEVFETEKEVFLILEYMEGGELTSRILSTVPFPETEVKFVFYQILLAVRYLHLNGITHRDLKPENILLVSDKQYPVIKVSDFGLSKIMDGFSFMDTMCGTIHYAAPEVINCYARYNKKADIWSLGVILFYMLTRTLPFKGTDKEAVAQKVLHGKIFWENPPWNNITISAKDLTRRMLLVDVEKRIFLQDIFKHEWIAKDKKVIAKVEQLTMPDLDVTDNFEEGIPKRLRSSNATYD